MSGRTEGAGVLVERLREAAAICRGGVPEGDEVVIARVCDDAAAALASGGSEPAGTGISTRRREVLRAMCEAMERFGDATGHRFATDCICGEGGFHAVETYDEERDYRFDDEALTLICEAIANAAPSSTPAPSEPAGETDLTPTSACRHGKRIGWDCGLCELQGPDRRGREARQPCEECGEPVERTPFCGWCGASQESYFGAQASEPSDAWSRKWWHYLPDEAREELRAMEPSERLRDSERLDWLEQSGNAELSLYNEQWGWSFHEGPTLRKVIDEFMATPEPEEAT